MSKKETISVKGTEIILFSHKKDDFISLTDMAKFKNAEATGLVIAHWLSTRYTVDFLGIWERMNNPNFNVTEFGNIKNERLVQLNKVAIAQMRSLVENRNLKQLN